MGIFDQGPFSLLWFFINELKEFFSLFFPLHIVRKDIQDSCICSFCCYFSSLGYQQGRSWRKKAIHCPQCCVVQCSAGLCSALQGNVGIFIAEQGCLVACRDVQWCTKLCSTVQGCVVLCRAVYYCAGLCSAMHGCPVQCTDVQCRDDLISPQVLFKTP